MSAVRIAVVGAGLIGARHIELVVASNECQLAAVVDPAPTAAELAGRYGVPHFKRLTDILSRDDVDGIIIATPNALHLEHGLACIEAGIPFLIEKPVAATIEDGHRLVAAAEASGSKAMVGHHRRHGALMASARDAVESGKLGRLVSVTGSAVYYKPDDYFEAGPWRREVGGGPVLLNLIHDIDNLRALVGEITAVQAVDSRAVRGFAAEDTAAITLEFANGALGTMIVSDAGASPRSWEHTSGENAAFPRSRDEDCYVITGTAGSLAIPTMRLKTFAPNSPASWTSPFVTEVITIPENDPLERQLAHFCAVIRGVERPRVTLRDGLRNLEVCLSISKAARHGKRVLLEK